MGRGSGKGEWEGGGEGCFEVEGSIYYCFLYDNWEGSNA